MTFLQQINQKLEYSAVEISIQPDLHVTQRGKEKIIKPEFSVEASDPRTPTIIGRLVLLVSLAARFCGSFYEFDQISHLVAFELRPW